MDRLTSTDLIAREAARLFESGAAATIGAAITAAAEALKLERCRRPGPGRVRQHIQAMSMQALGEAGYRERVASRLGAVEQLMTVLEESLPGAETLLAGRAARGHVDGGGGMHVRLYTEQRVERVAQVLVGGGYEEMAFETADTRFGRLSRIRIVEDDLELIVTRCLPAMRPRAGENLFDGKPVPTATLAQLRERLGEATSDER